MQILKRKLRGMCLTSDYNKKGQVQNILFMIVGFFAMAFVFIVVGGSFEDINDAWQGNIEDNLSKQIVGNSQSNFNSVWDFAFVFLLIGSIIAGIVGLFLIDSHPVVFILSMIALVAVLWSAAAMSNSFISATSTGAMSEWVDGFPITNAVMNYFVELILIIFALFSIAAYAKFKV